MQDELSCKRSKITQEMPLQFGTGHTPWRAPELPRNYHVTGYSPDDGEWKWSLFPKENAGWESSEVPPILTDQEKLILKNDGPSVPDRIQKIMHNVAAGKKIRKGTWRCKRA